MPYYFIKWKESNMYCSHTVTKVTIIHSDSPRNAIEATLESDDSMNDITVGEISTDDEGHPLIWKAETFEKTVVETERSKIPKELQVRDEI